MASIWAKIDRIVYGAERGHVHEMYFEDRHLNTTDFIRDAFKDDIVLQGSLLADSARNSTWDPRRMYPKRNR
jgi:tRNA(adenine34) deaminase